MFAGGVSRYIAENQQIELFHPDVMAGSLPQGAIQLNNTLFKLDMGPELMPALHRLKKNTGLVLTAKDALRHRLATHIQTVVLAVESSACLQSILPAECVQPPTPSSKAKQTDLLDKIATPPVLVFSSNPFCKDKCPAWVAMSGYISAKSEEGVRELYARLKPAKPPLVIDSRGGDLAVAMRLAAFLRVEGINVAVGKTELQGCKNDLPCFSLSGGPKYIRGHITNRAACDGACVFVLAGGKVRISDSAVLLKLYGLKLLNTHSESAIAPTDVRQFFASMSQNPEVANVMLRLPDQEHYSILASSQSMLGVINSASLPDWLDDPDRCDVAAVRIVCMRRN